MFCIDRINKDEVILENMVSSEFLHIHINKFDREIKEGNIFDEVNGLFYFNQEATFGKKEKIKNLLDRLK